MSASYEAAGTAATVEARHAREALAASRARTDQLEEDTADLDRNTQSREANNAATKALTSSIQSSMQAYQKHSAVNVMNIVNMGKQAYKAGILGTAQAALTGIFLAFADSVLAVTNGSR